MPLHGGVDYQITRIFNESSIFRPGASRHKEKDVVRQELAAQGFAVSSEALADATGLHSYAYARDCKDTWHRLGDFAKQHFKLKDMTALAAAHMEHYRTPDKEWKDMAAEGNENTPVTHTNIQRMAMNILANHPELEKKLLALSVKGSPNLPSAMEDFFRHAMPDEMVDWRNRKPTLGYVIEKYTKGGRGETHDPDSGESV
jgi:hypothetical protein